MILCDRSLREMLPRLVRDPDFSMINPASIDIRVGETAQLDADHLFRGEPVWHHWDLRADGRVTVRPGQFVLLSTLEWITVPNGYAIDLRLKSSRAREGWNHSLAFWFDPGWSGIGTMELVNLRAVVPLTLEYGMRIAQMIVHKLDGDAERPYAGRYQNAQAVEAAKPGN